MPRYVLLLHDYPTLHGDFMLEWSDALRTWRLAGIPTGEHEEQIAAEPLPDHRIAYLDYEGPVSGGRGTVVRIDRGEYEILAEENGRLSIRLNGHLLSGTAECRSVEAGLMWTFRPESDQAQTG